jgi:hypothetical protein
VTEPKDEPKDGDVGEVGVEDDPDVIEEPPTEENE